MNVHLLQVGMPVSILYVEQHDQMAILICLIDCTEHFGNLGPEIVRKNPAGVVTYLLSS